jgi:aspartate 1-decarboxylase
MRRIMLESKIHKVRVTETDLNYEGSLTLDESLMEAAGVAPFEQVHVYNISNGERFVTYLIKGQRDTGVVAVNGAAAHKAKKGDELIVAFYGCLEEEKIGFFSPKIILVDDKNRIKQVK